ncbi:MAG: carboxypeptidase-like regulatory domain-containing protein [Bdellovibrionaceae bacterium]|nr:carboxypeptidase-like regulatory domain-containing protein [Pseudobdellovibrionaceae bacterium]
MKLALSCLLCSMVAYSQATETTVTSNEAAPIASKPVTGTLTFKGRVLEKGTQLPMKDINVFLLPQKLKVQTDINGDFLFENLDPGRYQLIINLSGYKKLEKDIALDAETKKLKHYIEKETYLGFETTVVGQKQKRDQTQKTLTQEQFLGMPGSGGDPVKAVQNLPGVNRVQGFSSQVVVQGGEPKDTSYHIDGHEIPIVFHFGGLTSVVMPEALEQVDYLSAGYGVDYSRATGGIIGLMTRKPEPGERKKKSFFFADNLKLGGLYEGQIDEKSDFLISARASYIGIFLGAVAKGREDFNLTVAPEFYDITGIYNRKLDEKQNLKIITLASRDTLAFVLKEPLKTDPAFRGNFYNETQFYRFVPQWTYKVDDETQYKVSTGIGQNQIVVDLGEQYLNLRFNVLTFRAEGEKVFSPTWVSQLGVDNLYGDGTAKIKLVQPRSDGGVSNPFSASEVKERNTLNRFVNTGLYNRHELKLSDWTLVPGFRVDRYKFTNETYLVPRLAVRYNWNPSFVLKAAAGRYYQPSEGQEQDKTFGNPDIRAPRADHLTFGFEKDFRGTSDSGLTWQSSYFDKWLDQIVVQSYSLVERDGVLVDENYNNSGRGRAYGIENQIKWNDAFWDVWLSYTWSESFRWSDRIAKYKHEYDQTHNFNLVAAKKLENNWKVSGRFRYVTGNPYTPIVDGTFDADNDVYLPKRGSFYSERYTDFYQADLRIDKKWIYDEEIWTLYLDIQNVLNTKNSESIEYSFNYKNKEFISGLPFLPAFGVKGEF